MSSETKLKIIRVPVPSPTLWPYTTTNCYFIGNEHESILVDAGYDRPETKKELEKAIKDHHLAIPKKIILTHSHPDHAPGVRQLSDWDPAVFCHTNGRKTIETMIAPVKQLTTLADNVVIRIAGEPIRVLHVPGHSKDQINLYLPSEQILIAGDNILSEGTTAIVHPDGNMNDYLASLTRLKELKLKKIGPGHGEWILNPYEHIQFIYQRRLDREKQILSLLKEHEKLTSAKLTEMIYQDTIHPSIFDVAEKTIDAHLEKLMNDELVQSEDSVYSIKPAVT